MSLREKLLQGKFRTEKVTIDIGEGPFEVTLRQPSVAARGKIMAASGALDGAGNVKDLGRLQVTAVIACAYDSDGKKVFEAADEAALLESPAGGWFDEVSQKAIDLLNVDTKDAAKK
jgi:hypothetical protein